jgi:hypothetical protein
MALADPQFDELNATTLKEIWPRIIFDQWGLDTPFFAYLRAKCLSPYNGGAFMQNTHLVKPMIGGYYAPGADWNMTLRETLAETTFVPKYIEVGVPAYLEQVLVENVGDLAAFSLVNTRLTNAMMTGSAITAVSLALHGQSAGGGVIGNRPQAINGWIEALNDGITPGWDGSIFTSYGNQPRNAFVGSTLNSVPVFGGNPTTGGTAPVSYSFIEELYQTAKKGRKEPDLIASNKAFYAYVKEKIQPQQRFVQERDPYWGVSGMRINNAMFLADEYFPSLKFGQNDPDLGNWLTGTFVSPGTTANGGTAAATSNLPASGTTVTVGEVMCMFRMSDFLYRVADNPVYGWGFSGIVPIQSNSRVFGTVKAAQQLQCLSPRTQIQAYGLGG